MIEDASGRSAMPASHLLLALLVVAVWGTNFVVCHQALINFPPLTLATLRVVFGSLPLLPFLRWPDVPLKTVMTYGLISGALQFGLVVYAMAGHISPGLASVLLQVQAFLTAMFMAASDGERLSRRDVLGLTISCSGIALIGAHVADGDASGIGIACILGAATAWACANTVVRRARPVRVVSLVAWGNAFAILPLFATVLLAEGPARILDSLSNASFGGWTGALWQAYANGILGYGIWNWLLARHPASRIAPFSLLVPVFGLGASAWYLSESLQIWKMAATIAVVAGLFIGLYRPTRSGPTAQI